MLHRQAPEPDAELDLVTGLITRLVEAVERLAVAEERRNELLTADSEARKAMFATDQAATAELRAAFLDTQPVTTGRWGFIDPETGEFVEVEPGELYVRKTDGG